MFEKNTHILPKHSSYDYAIDLQNEVQVSFGPIFNFLQNGFLALKYYIEENFVKNFIQHFKSFARVQIHFV